MGIRRRTRRLRRWYRRHEHSNGFLAVRIAIIVIFGVTAFTIVFLAM